MMHQLCEEAEIFHDSINPVEPRAFQRLTQKLRNVFPEAKLFFYGSRVMGLDTSESDLDVYVELCEF